MEMGMEVEVMHCLLSKRGYIWIGMEARRGDVMPGEQIFT